VEADVRWSALEKRLEGGHAEVVDVQGIAAVGAEDETGVLPEVADPESLGVLSRLAGLEDLDGRGG
jgi:hypothetical protein